MDTLAQDIEYKPAEKNGAVAEGFSVDSLVQAYQVTESLFDIRLSKGQVLTARILADASGYANLKRHAALMQKVCAAGGTEELRPWLPADPEIITGAVFMEALLVEPKISFVDALRIAKTCGLLFFEIANPLIEQVAKEITQAENEGIVEAGEG